jgi:hypothetical protein
MYRVFRFKKVPTYWPASSTVFVDYPTGDVEQYITDNNGTRTLVSSSSASIPANIKAGLLAATAPSSTNRFVTYQEILGITGTNADWNATSGPSFILNKPTIPSIAGLATTSYVDTQDALKVDKVTGKGLSTNDYTTAEQTKLAGIAAGAEVNVNADWNATSGDAQILNKPTIPTGIVTDVTATSPITSTGGTTPVISTSMSTNKLIGRSTASTGVMEEISIGTGLTLSGGILNNSATPTPTGYYGAFQDDTTQTVVSINTAYSVKLNTVDLSNGVSVVNDGSGNPTRITLANTGIYNIQFSLQLEKTGGSGNMIVDIWVRKNNVDIPATTGKVVLTGSANASPVIAAWNYVLDLAAGDYIQLMWATNNDHVVIKAAAATSPHPSIPSAILTVTQQSGIMAGTGITAINSLTGAAQTLTTGTTGTDFAIVDSGTDHKFNLPVASATNTGKLSSTDWTTFNNKLPYLGATTNLGLGANSLFASGLGIGVTNLSLANATIRGTSPSVGSAFLIQNSTPSTIFNVLNNGFVGIGTNTPVSLLHIGTGASTTLGDFNTPVITFNSVNNGIYLDSNKLFFKAAGAFNFGIDSTGVLGTQFRINGGSNNLTTPVFVPHRLTPAGLASGFGGNSVGDICLITNNTTRLRINSNGDLGFFGVTPAARQPLGAATAASTYGTNEQAMLQKAYELLRTFGLGT